MLRLTKKADYGLMALKYLAEQATAATPPAAQSAKDIAQAYHIPPPLLAKILQTLARAGLLVSHAGTNGGYALAKPAPARSPPSKSSAPSTARSSSPVASPFTEPATSPAIAPSKNHCARSTTPSRTCSATSISATSWRCADGAHCGRRSRRRRPGHHPGLRPEASDSANGPQFLACGQRHRL